MAVNSLSGDDVVNNLIRHQGKINKNQNICPNEYYFQPQQLKTFPTDSRQGAHRAVATQRGVSLRGNGYRVSEQGSADP